MLKNQYISRLHFKTQLKLINPDHHFNNSKRGAMALSCRKKSSALLKGYSMYSKSLRVFNAYEIDI